MPQQFISNNGQKLVNNALQSTGLDKVGITTAVDKAGKQLNKQFKKTFGSEDTKNKIALEEQTEKDNKKKRADQVAYNKMSDEEKRAHDNQKAVDQRIKSEQDAETQKQLYDSSDWGKQQNAKKEHKGARKGSVSGKGSRPENLDSIASKIALGRNRSLDMNGGDIEQESRKGSSISDPLAQQIISDNVEEDFDGYNFFDARNALRREGYSEDEIEDNIDAWMYKHMN